MKVTVIFPKSQYYYGKDINTQRIYRSIFKKYIELLVKCNCTIEYFLEDEIAKNLFEELDIVTNCVTCLTNSDLSFSEQYPDLFELPSYIRKYYSDVQSFVYDMDTKYVIPPTYIRDKGKEAYLEKRAEIARKKLRTATDRYLSEKNCVMQFRANNNVDRTTAVRETISTGDGRLCIEIAPDANSCVAYYGGVYVPEDLLESILSM